MKQIAILEHMRITKGIRTRQTENRTTIATNQFERLREFDETSATSSGATIFEWKARTAKARQWVGVIEIEGLSIEILPKIARDGDEDYSKTNLIHMLSVADKIPLRTRDLANQSLVDLPLSETLIRAFAESLAREFHRGLSHDYLSIVENIRIPRGKILVSKNLSINSVRKDRFVSEYDQFSADNALNRILKSCCHILLASAATRHSIRLITNSLIRLDDVADVEISYSDFERIHFNRQNERFSELFEFAKLVHRHQSPTASSGVTKTFSLLFDMNEVFESYLANVFRNHVVEDGWRVREQGRGDSRPLAMLNGEKITKLKPDITLYRGKHHKVVIDAKWKTLRNQSDGRKGVSKADMMQLFTYAHHYNCRDVVLLYPMIPGVEEATFEVEVRKVKRSIHLRFVDVGGNLRQRESVLVEELKRIVKPMLNRVDTLVHADDRVTP